MLLLIHGRVEHRHTHSHHGDTFLDRQLGGAPTQTHPPPRAHTHRPTWGDGHKRAAQRSGLLPGPRAPRGLSGWWRHERPARARALFMRRRRRLRRLRRRLRHRRCLRRHLNGVLFVLPRWKILSPRVKILGRTCKTGPSPTSLKISVNGVGS